MGKLNRLELYNFKSYKGHHTLLFGDSYFTSIIGPNGSGKSNSMDAISFVLGIKSSHLRSTHLRDLVYRGRVLKTSVIQEDGSSTANGLKAQTAKDDDETGPKNATQERNDPKSAWVCAVYEDDAGDEQSWKRTITSQGASEYRINNKAVTAQQYNEALQAENILIKARNFLVFQGDVEAIASQSPKDLTRLIEQISGSLEFKAKYEQLKEAQEEAVENQNYNLNRRRGINSEIKQYQEQKQEAESYAKKVEQKDRAIVTQILCKLYQFQLTIEETTTQVQRVNEELKDSRRGISKYENNLEEARKDYAKAGREIGKIEKSIRAKNLEIEEKENSLLPIAEKIQLTGDSLERAKARIATVSKEHENKTNTVKRLEKDLGVVRKAEDQWEKDWKRVGDAGGRALNEQDIKAYTKLKEELNQRTSVEQNQIDNLIRQRRADEETVKSLNSKVESVKSRVAELESDIETVRRSKSNTQEILDRTSTEIQAKKQEYKALTGERRRLAQLRTELDEKLQEVCNKLIEAEDGRTQTDKELRLKASIADMKRFFPGVRGRIHELCKPKQKKYGEAVSTMLGRHIDAIVVDDEKTARDCLQYLREGRHGQATFIPLDTIQATAIDSNLKGIHRGSRMGIDVIEYDKIYEPAMSYACGNALVCDNLEIAKYICYEKRIEAKVVTLQGTVIHKGGLMTGGRGREQGRKRWGDAEVDNLRKMADKFREDLSSLPDSRRNAADEENLQSQIVGLEQQSTYAKSELESFQRNLRDKEKELQHSKSNLKEVTPKYLEKQREMSGLVEQLQRLQVSTNEVEDDIFADFCRRLKYRNIREYEAQQGLMQQEVAQKRLEFKQQKSRLDSQKNLELKQLQETTDRLQSLQNKLDREHSLIKELESQSSTHKAESKALARELEVLKEKLGNLQVSHDEKSEKVAELRREVQKRNKALEGTIREISNLETTCQRTAAERYALLRRCKLEDIAIPLAKGSRSLASLPIEGVHGTEMDIDADETGLSQGVLDMQSVQDYGIEVDFERVQDDYDLTSSDTVFEQLQNEISALDEELKNMAPNMRAIERLEGVESRLKTTEIEFEDARKKAKKAKEDFQDIKERRFELFNKAFSHISEQIDPIYKELTKSASFPLGGQAYLDMEDSEEPYLDGIKYHAMPPLKRFRDMEHLSGGEKTMAALALLFAIHSYQPSPFFVLDEVDAALDNANVSKIANYIRDHAGPGMQFIVISLKTGLFQGSEALVGIHRDQTANSSKALTLDLRKYR